MPKKKKTLVESNLYLVSLAPLADQSKFFDISVWLFFCCCGILIIFGLFKLFLKRPYVEYARAISERQRTRSRFQSPENPQYFTDLTFKKISTGDYVIFDTLDRQGIILKRLYPSGKILRKLHVRHITFTRNNADWHGVVFTGSAFTKAVFKREFPQGLPHHRGIWVRGPIIPAQYRGKLSILSMGAPVLPNVSIRPGGIGWYFVVYKDNIDELNSLTLQI